MPAEWVGPVPPDRMNRKVAIVAIVLMVSSCALDPSVTVYPLLLTPTTERPFAHFVNLVEARDFGGALTRTWTVETKAEPTGRELAALGRFQAVRGQFDEAVQTLIRAFELARVREERAEIAWDLSQALFLAEDYDGSLEWAEMAATNGLRIADWHLSLLENLSEIDLDPAFEGASGSIPMAHGNPRIPRILTTVNGTEPVEAVIDSGAVFTILSTSLAEEASVRRLGRSGTLRGLLNEPIPIEFGVVDRLEIGELVARDLLVAIIPDDLLSFLIDDQQQYQMKLLLGTNLLRQTRVKLDFSSRSAEIVPVSRKPVDDQNLFFYDFRPMVQVSINRRGWLPFLLDTGSEVTFLNASLVGATSLREREQIHGATLQGLGGSKKRGAQLVDVELVTGGWGGSFRTLPMYASEQSQVFGIIGENFLDNFEVVIDFGKMRFDLLRSGRSAGDWLDEAGGAAPTGIEPG